MDNDKKYIILRSLIIVGCLMILTYFLTLIPCLNIREWDVFFTVIMSIGSGLMCSGIVSLIVEKHNDERNIINKINLKKNFLKNIKEDLLYLLVQENLYLSTAINIYFKNKTEKKKIEVSFNTMILSIQSELEEILNININRLFPNKNIGVDKKWLEDNLKYKFNLCLNGLTYYKRIKNDMDNLLDNKIILLSNDILSQEEITTLQNCNMCLDEILFYSEKQLEDAVHDYKEIFYKDCVLKILSVIKSDINEIISDKYYVVKKNKKVKIRRYKKL